MWSPSVLLFLVASAAAVHEHGWKLENEYNYLIRSRSMATWRDMSDQYTGMLMKGILTVQANTRDVLRAKLSKMQYAQVHTNLPEGWESEISDRNLEYQDLPLTSRSFEIMMKHGVVRELIVADNVPTWEVNILKSIVSQLQVDTQGENAKMTRSTQIPRDEQPYAMFKAMEDSVGGKCEVLYDIVPLQEHVLQHRPELVPMPNLREDGLHIDIMKTKNYSKCEQRMSYHFGITGRTNWEPGSNDNGRLLSKSSTSRIVISGTLRRFTIQSSVTTNKIFISPKLRNDQLSMISSKINLTLATVSGISRPIEVPPNAISTGNLVYTYNEPFSSLEKRRLGKSSVSPNSVEESGSSSISSRSSSEEVSPGTKLWDSSSESKSSSSMSSSEEGDFWQQKSKLDEPPNDPLLPYFIGYRGKPIWMSDKINPIKATRNLIGEIATELEDPNDMPDKQTLEKFTILTNLIRTMSKKQIEQIEGDTYARRMDDGIKRNAWAVLRDAIAETGTGPALMTIKDWIRDRKIESYVAADVIGRIPNSARMPTSDYMDYFYSIVSDPRVQKEPHLNTSSVLAFTDLLRRAEINNGSVHNRYPVHIYGRLISKHSPRLLREYIPFLSEQLKSAIRENDSSRIQVYILALGNLGHPAILGVLEPYLEGKVPVSTFQRLMMVASLSKLADLHPKLARSVLYKIYLNTKDLHEIRCIAVFLIMKTNPPLGMLQRMAQFTNYDSSAQVNAAVKSSINTAARLKHPEWRTLARNARLAQILLSPKQYSYRYSHSHVVDSEMSHKNLGYDLLVNYIGSDDTVLPKAWYISLATHYGEFEAPSAELVMMVSSIKELLYTYWRKYDKTKDESASKSQQLAEMLKIVIDRPEPLEGNVLWKTQGLNAFIPFDERNLERWMKVLAHLGTDLKSGREMRLSRFVNYDVLFSFPMESGIPFVYSMEVPVLLKLTGRVKVEDQSNDAIEGQVDLRLVVSKRIQARTGFVTPFDHQHFIAGEDTSIQGYVAGTLQASWNQPERKLRLRLRPDETEKKGRLFHFSIVPFTSRRDLLDLSPVSLGRSTLFVHRSEPQKIVLSSPNDRILALKVEAEAESLSKMTSFDWNFDPIEGLVFPWSLFDSTYRKLNVFFNPRLESDEWVTLMVSYGSKKWLNSDSQGKWEGTVTATSPGDSSAEVRRTAFLVEAAKGINSARSYVVDLELDIPAKYKNKQIFTAALGMSNVDPKTRVLFYWNVAFPDQQISYEACAGLQTRLLKDEVKETTPTREFSIDVKFGTSCSEGERVGILGKQIQSKEFKEEMERSMSVMKCQEQMKQGEGSSSRTCQRATALMDTLDQLDMTMKFDHQFSLAKIFTKKAIDVAKQIYYPNVRLNAYNPKHLDDNRVDIRMKLQPNLQDADVILFMANSDVTFERLSLVRFVLELHKTLHTDRRMAIARQISSSCILGSREVATFDDRRYPLKFTDCDYVAMTTVPRGHSKRFPRIPEDMRVSVIVRGNSRDRKEATIILGDSEIRMSSSGSQIKVTANGDTVQYSQTKSYSMAEGDDLAFEIFEMPNREVKLVSDKYSIDAIYDGERLEIKVSDKYRKSVRGLCGDLDSEPDNDFLTPKNCMLTKPDEFASTYAMTESNCDDKTIKLARKAEDSVCTRPLRELSDVVSDLEAGRPRRRSNWGYHSEDIKNRPENKRCNTYRTKVIEGASEICFTTRPVPTCAEGCMPIESKTKEYSLYCMPQSEAARQTKKRVEQGANPDFSKKTVSRKYSMEVPLGCKTAMR